ncbi:MAG: 50S ribosomal protein L11 methyltransferase [Patescibacteria group bacterium]|nr:50S ribosomal protein L11 methyltransferase [Patescibacteria group bacterium]
MIALALIFTVTILVFAIAIVTVLTIISSLIAIIIVGVPFAPTPDENVKLIINQLNLKPNKILYDLGCGDGRFLIAAAKLGLTATGYEISPLTYLKAQLNILLHHSPAKVKLKNFYSVNIADADYVICFLIDRVMAKVEKKLTAELKSGVKVVSYCFAFPNWQPDEIINPHPNRIGSSKIYFYTKI